MNLSIQLREIPEELLHRLDERAGVAGVDRAAYIRWLIERDVLPPASQPTLSEILAPVHEATIGLSEDELEKLVTDELDAARRERSFRPHRAR